MTNLITQFTEVNNEIAKIENKEEQAIELMNMSYFGSGVEKRIDARWEKENNKLQQIANAIIETLISKATAWGLNTDKLRNIQSNEQRRKEFILKGIEKGLLQKV